MSITDIVSTVLIALSLSVDCFAVTMGGCVSLRNIRYIQLFRTALTFGLFQAVMPVIGWLAGSRVVEYIQSYDHWVVFALLAVVGGKMIWEAVRGEDECKPGADITRGLLLFSMAFATSIDALAVGLSFAFMETDIVFSVIVIGVVAFLITHLGFLVGKKAGSVLGTRAKIIGGIVLIGIGLKVLITHLIGV